MAALRGLFAYGRYPTTTLVPDALQGGGAATREEPASSPSSVPRARLDSLTGMRFIAAFLVLLYHAPQTFDGIPGLRLVVSSGHVGVTFFFVLSGFVLTWSWRPFTPVRRFYWRRVARIVPLHVLTWAMAVGVLLLEAQQLHPKVMLASLVLVQAWIPSIGFYYGMNGVSWSLSCEAFFYALFPALVPWALQQSPTRALRAAAVALAALVLGTAAVHLTWDGDVAAFLWVFPAYRLGEFVVGVLLASAVLGGWRPRVSRPQALALVAAAFVVVTLGHVAQLVASPGVEPTQELAGLVMLPFFAVLIASSAVDDVHGRRALTAHPVLVRLGEWSFALYLIHQLVLRVVTSLAPDAAALPVPVLLAGMVAFIVVSVTLSAGLYTLFEKPVERKLRGVAWGR